MTVRLRHADTYVSAALTLGGQNSPVAASHRVEVGPVDSVNTTAHKFQRVRGRGLLRHHEGSIPHHQRGRLDRVATAMKIGTGPYEIRLAAFGKFPGHERQHDKADRDHQDGRKLHERPPPLQGLSPSLERRCSVLAERVGVERTHDGTSYDPPDSSKD